MEKESRNWAELNTDCLIKVFEMVGLESLTLEIPFVCKSWYKASLNPQCWKILRFPPSLCEDEDSWWYDDGFIGRFMDEYRIQNFSVTGCYMHGSYTFGPTPFQDFFGELAKLQQVGSVRDYQSKFEKLLSKVGRLPPSRCPSLKYLGLPSNLLSVHGELIQELISKWKDLQQLFLGDTEFSFKEILIQISLNCKNFNGLSAKGYVGNKEASAIATLLPNINYLWLKETTLPLESLKMILLGCRELVLLDARNCEGFEAEDDEILKMASHIKTFMTEGSCEYEEYEESLSYRDGCIDDDYCSD
ncbi:F-box/LRR-repeat protein At3g48880-like [Telopea speciosissima]|uniref:F-box/LRR-repeat protein At3g48880-like n=1 Tax=Telopea speciosissima TaxID=54955 RepID=UPI001CC33629|nr:F-box/LRR-repeat protein At3g48880-like [Telopea speciosissima]